MARTHCVVALALLALLSQCSTAAAGVSLSSLPQDLVVVAQLNGQNITNSSTMVYLYDNLTVTWQLNFSYVGSGVDAGYQNVQIVLCYGAPSQQGRAWRASNNDLSKSKNCKYTIATQPYNAAGNTTTWQAGRNIPGALYYVRAYALNSTSSSASAASNAVGVGQTSNVNMTTNLFAVQPYPGTTITLDITIIVLSVASYVLLFGYFFAERMMKKNK